jgi:hypothetical protein
MLFSLHKCDSLPDAGAAGKIQNARERMTEEQGREVQQE